MESANKIYRKVDIERMSGANPGFGIGGARNYDIFLFKGGPQCGHYWKMRIYKAPAKENDYVYYPTNVQDEKFITAAKARSQGFTAERNDSLVATAPRRMKNNGYYN